MVLKVLGAMVKVDSSKSWGFLIYLWKFVDNHRKIGKIQTKIPCACHDVSFSFLSESFQFWCIVFEIKIDMHLDKFEHNMRYITHFGLPVGHVGTLVMLSSVHMGFTKLYCRFQVMVYLDFAALFYVLNHRNYVSLQNTFSFLQRLVSMIC